MISFNCNLPNSFMHPVWSSTRSCCLTHLTSQTAVVGKNVNAAIGAAEKQSRLREGSKPWWDLCLLTSLRVLIQKVIPESCARDQWGWLFSGLGLPHHGSDLGAEPLLETCPRSAWANCGAVLGNRRTAAAGTELSLLGEGSVGENRWKFALG